MLNSTAVSEHVARIDDRRYSSVISTAVVGVMQASMDVVVGFVDCVAEFVNNREYSVGSRKEDQDRLKSELVKMVVDKMKSYASLNKEIGRSQLNDIGGVIHEFNKILESRTLEIAVSPINANKQQPNLLDSFDMEDYESEEPLDSYELFQIEYSSQPIFIKPPPDLQIVSTIFASKRKTKPRMPLSSLAVSKTEHRLSCNSIFGITKIDDRSLSLVDSSAVDNKYLPAVDKILSKSSKLQCTMCFSLANCHGVLDIGKIRLMTTSCKCRLQSKAADNNYAYNVVVVDDSYSVKCMLDRNIAKCYDNDGYYKDDVIWHSRASIVYRESGNYRLVEVLKSDIGYRNYSQWKYFEVTNDMVDEPVAHMILRENEDHAILWQNGRFILLGNRTEIIDKLSEDTSKWHIIHETSTKAIILAGMQTVTKPHKLHFFLYMPTAGSSILATIDARHFNNDSAVGRIISKRQDEEWSVVLAMSHYQYIHILGVSPRSIQVITANYDVTGGNNDYINTTTVIDGVVHIGSDNGKLIKIVLNNT